MRERERDTKRRPHQDMNLQETPHVKYKIVSRV